MNQCECTKWLTRATLFRKNKYSTSHSSCQHCTTAQSSFCWQGSSVLTCCIPPQPWQKDAYTIWFGLKHGVTFHCSTPGKCVASGWLAEHCCPLWVPSSSIALAISFAPESVFVLALWQTDQALGISVLQVRMLPWLAFSLAERLLLALLHCSCPLGCSGDGCLLAQLLIELRFQKPWVWVILH